MYIIVVSLLIVNSYPIGSMVLHTYIYTYTVHENHKNQSFMLGKHTVRPMGFSYLAALPTFAHPILFAPPVPQRRHLRLSF